jgi:hypothetical protein
VKKLAISFVFILALTSCSATGPLFNPESMEGNSKSNLYIYRSWKFFNGGGWPNIYLNGKKLFALKNNGYGILYLEPGNYEIKAEGSFFLTNWYPGPASININVEANNEYYIRVTPQHDKTIYGASGTVAMTGSAQIVLVPKEVAMKEIVETKKVN